MTLISTDPTFEGLEVRRNTWGQHTSADPLMEQARAALASGAPDAWGEAITRIPNTPNRTLTRLLLLHFSPEAGDILRHSGRLDDAMLLNEAIRYHPRALGWISKDKAGVFQVQAAIPESVRKEDQQHSLFQQDKLGMRLVGLGMDDMDGVLDCLLAMDIESAFEHHGIKERHIPWAHPGMWLLADLFKKPGRMDPAKLAKVVDRMLSPATLKAVLGKEFARSRDIQACQLDPIIRAAIGTRWLEDDTLALERLQALTAHSKVVQDLLPVYWALDEMPQKVVTLAHMDLDTDPSRTRQLLPDKAKARNVVDALLMRGRDWVKTAMKDHTPNGDIFWNALGRGENMHGLHSQLRKPEIVAMLPDLLKRPGAAWRDANGNNLAHVLALSRKREKKQALFALSRLPGGTQLIMEPNKEGHSALWMTEHHPYWKSEAPDFHKRLREQMSRVQRKVLTAMSKEKQQVFKTVRQAGYVMYPEALPFPENAGDYLVRRGLRKTIDWLADTTHTTTNTLSRVQAEEWLLKHATPTKARDLADINTLSGNYTGYMEKHGAPDAAMRRADGRYGHLAWAQLIAQEHPEVLLDYVGNAMSAATWASLNWDPGAEALILNGAESLIERMKANDFYNPMDTLQDRESGLVSLALAWARCGPPQALPAEACNTVEALAERMGPLIFWTRHQPELDLLMAFVRRERLRHTAQEDTGAYPDRVRPKF